MKKTVAIIGTRGYPSYYGGFETAVRKLAPHLSDSGWDVTVYGRPGSTEPHDPTRDTRVHSQETYGFETSSLSTLSFGLSSVLHALRSKPDVALVMNVANGFWLPLLRLRGIPVVVNVDGIEWERAKWGTVAKAMFRAGAWMTAKFATELIADSVHIAHRWDRDFRRRARFVPYGGDIPGDLSPVDGLNHRGYILIVARFVPENTISEFFDAVELLADRHPIVIVGSSGYGGHFDERAEYLASKFEDVEWLGHVSDDVKLHALWKHSGAYFHGHSVGGTNPALVQAMACGAPIVARDTIYNREVLADTAVFAEPLVESIVYSLDSAMEAAIHYDASPIVERARAKYSWAGVCDAYERALLDQIALTRTDAPPKIAAP